MGFWERFGRKRSDSAELKAVSIAAATDPNVQQERDGLDESPPFYELGMARQLATWDQRLGLDSNVVMAPVMWIMRTFIEATAIVQRRQIDEDSGSIDWGRVIDHPAELLLDDPNDYYDGDTLWQATIVSFILAGNAYWRKIRNDIGEVVQLWYLPHFLVTPHRPDDGERYLDYYEYRPAGGSAPERIALRDIVHFRFGQDPRDTRLGLSPLRPLIREICTDDEAAIFSAAILRNMGVPGVVISPKDTSVPTRLSPTDVQQVRNHVDTRMRRGGQGRTLVFGTPTDIAQFGFDPNQLTLANLRDISEERVCSMLGLPAPVVGFGSGVQATKVGATMREYVRLAWVQCLSPMQSSMAKQTSRQLLGDFHAQTRRFRIRFDTTDVAGFQEDDNQAAERAARLVSAGILRVDRAQSMLGLEVDDTQKVYLRPANTVPIDEAGDPVAANPIPPAIQARLGAGAAGDGSPNGNGNGGGVAPE